MPQDTATVNGFSGDSSISEILNNAMGSATPEQIRLAKKQLQMLQEQAVLREQAEKVLTREKKQEQKEQEREQKVREKERTKEQKEEEEEAKEAARIAIAERISQYIYMYPLPGFNPLYYVRLNLSTHALRPVVCDPSHNPKPLWSQVAKMQDSDYIKDFNQALIEYKALYKQKPLGKSGTIAACLLGEAVDLMPKENILTELPKAITNNRNTLALDYFDDSLVVEGPFPTWQIMLNRMGAHAEKFAAFVYGCTRENFQGKQVLNLYGDAQSGKSAILRTIQFTLFPNSNASVTDKTFSSTFGGAEIVGKRLLVNGDVRVGHILASELIHQLTGGDGMRVEPKGMSPYTVPAHACLFFASNPPLQIDNEDNQILRLLPIRVTKELNAPRGKDQEWEDSFAKEIYHFMHYAKGCYERWVRNSEVSVKGIDFAPHWTQMSIEIDTVLSPYCEKAGESISDEVLSSALLRRLDVLKCAHAQVTHARKLMERQINYRFKSYKTIIDDKVVWPGLTKKTKVSQNDPIPL